MSASASHARLIATIPAGLGSIRFVYSPVAPVDVPWVVMADALEAVGAPEREVTRLLGSLWPIAEMRRARLGAAIVQIVPPWYVAMLFDEIAPEGPDFFIAFTAAIRAAYPAMDATTRAFTMLGAPSAGFGEMSE